MVHVAVGGFPLRFGRRGHYQLTEPAELYYDELTHASGSWSAAVEREDTRRRMINHAYDTGRDVFPWKEGHYRLDLGAYCPTRLIECPDCIKMIPFPKVRRNVELLLLSLKDFWETRYYRDKSGIMQLPLHPAWWGWRIDISRDFLVRVGLNPAAIAMLPKGEKLRHILDVANSRWHQLVVARGGGCLKNQAAVPSSADHFLQGTQL